MIIGACELDLWIPESRSLKQDNHDLWQRCRLGVVIASTDTRYAHQVLNKVVDYVRSDGRVELLDYTIEMR
jgi:uncharacterized protein YlxP (DUF503 family)